MSGLLQSLKASGELVLWLAARSGSFQDWSGQGNDGTPDATTIWQNGSWAFPAAASDIVVADAAELQLTAGALIVHADFMQQIATEYFFSKEDGGGVNFGFSMNATQLRFYDGTNTRTLTVNVTGTHEVAVNFSDGEICEGFVNGLSAGAFNAASDVSVDDANLIIGNLLATGSPFQSHLWDALIVNRKLTASEHAIMYSELSPNGGPS